MKIKSEKVSIEVSPELNLQLNPLSTGKKKKRFPSLIFVSILVIICGVGYISYVLYEENLYPDKVTEKKIVEITQPITIAPDTLEIEKIDTTIHEGSEEITETEEVTPIEPKVSEDGLTEQIVGNSYLVVGSFKELAMARKDALRLEQIYQGLKISTTTKLNGDYINYIFTTVSNEEAMNAREEFSDKFDKIKGIWVYDMKK